MKLAFCIFKYFPYGGLQRDMYRAIEIAIERGHEVDIYTMEWKGDVPLGATIKIISCCGWTNHSRAVVFSVKLNKLFNNLAYDKIIGFNKTFSLDIYFTGENCFAQHIENKSSKLFRYLPRYFSFTWLERKVFNKNSGTDILLISDAEKAIYQKFYHTEDHRFHALLPGIEKRTFSNDEASLIRKTLRETHCISDETIWILFVASDYALKGLGRVLDALQSLDGSIYDHVVLSVIGYDDPTMYKAFLERHHVKTRVDFLGASNKVYEFMTAADLLVHPAKIELAGKVLLEALVNHLPVLTTAICGCAHYIKGSQGGEVLSEPFSQKCLTEAFQDMIRPNFLRNYKKNLIEYKMDERVYESHQQIIECVESTTINYVRDFFLDNDLINHLPRDKKRCLDFVFSLTGVVYREVKSRKTIATSIQGKEYFIKIHHGVGWREILKNILVFKSATLGARQEYKAIRAMKKASILVPEVCAYATEGWNPAKINSFIITKRIRYQQDLEKLTQTWKGKPVDFLFKRRLIHRVAIIARKMHHAGMNHRDFYLCHLLLDSRTQEDFDLYLIDLHRVQIRRKVPLRWKVKDLSGLYFSAMDIGLGSHDLYYFLSEYYQQPIKDILRKKRWLLRWISVRANNLYRRHQLPMSTGRE